MITAEAASESTVPAVPGDTAATGVPEREELVWPWKDAPIRELVQRIHQLQAERAQAFRRLEERSMRVQGLRAGAVALLQLMGTPELTGQEDSLQMHQLKMKVIKTMEAISEVLQDLRFDAESAE
ncbi:PREDICTED: uncharacterized protein C19orf60 homolog [Bison bison bison]|uniref:Uncharacterized protein C19orf60 homolog n=1 Tax=Bison bison bison TaxID=43346 RepID=A0A6P3HSN2_BISBB|nr:PREDICTED: uncharacterized protein C19orf60 homolog [Bison bison bison]